ncbi:MAG TPA: hypothetical protein VKG24_00400 [Pseudolabrys sp.]|nr:hypothetical protein [Pseudolabrys sp.]
MHAGIIAQVPQWITDALYKSPPVAVFPGRKFQLSDEQARAKLNGIIRTIALAPEGERNRRTFLGRLSHGRNGRCRIAVPRQRSRSYRRR